MQPTPCTPRTLGGVGIEGTTVCCVYVFFVVISMSAYFMICLLSFECQLNDYNMLWGLAWWLMIYCVSYLARQPCL